MNLAEELARYGAVETDQDSIPNTSGVYLLCSDQSVVYVGHSQSLGRRVKAHLAKKTFSRVFFIRHPGRSRMGLETALIALYHPKQNILKVENDQITTREKKVLLLRAGKLNHYKTLIEEIQILAPTADQGGP